MVWFNCDDCGDSIKKPKLQTHFYNCSASRLTCIDCGRCFDRASAQSHTSCVTEHEKYAKGATKPGGYAADGFYRSTNTQEEPQVAGATGLEHLSKRPPWICSLCNVTCTSSDTLLGHAGGAKHKRRARAAAAAVMQDQPSASMRPSEVNEHSKAVGADAKTDEAKFVVADVGNNGAGTQHFSSELKATKSIKKRKVEDLCSTQAVAELPSIQPANGAQDEPTPAPAKPKWKKLARSFLLGRRAGMPISKLQQKVLVALGCTSDAEVAKDSMLAKWHASSKFKVAGGRVYLQYDA